MDKKFVYILEGLVGSGKSTCIKSLEKIFNCRVFAEHWEVECESLKTYYKSSSGERVRFANLTLQLYIIHRLYVIFEQIIEDNDHQLFFIDRGILGSLSFLCTGRDGGILSPEEEIFLSSAIKSAWITLVNHFKTWGVIKTIYFDCEPKTAWQRYHCRCLSLYGALDETNPVTLWGDELNAKLSLEKFKDLREYDSAMEHILRRKMETVNANKTAIEVCQEVQDIVYVEMKRNQIVNFYLDKENFI